MHRVNFEGVRRFGLKFTEGHSETEQALYLTVEQGALVLHSDM